MKKSKLIVPALAVIAFSTAASITGTVAWFTASRSATFTTGSYAVVKTNADLKLKLYSGVQTTAAADNSQVNVNQDMKLTDASFDHLADNGTGKIKGKFAVPNAEGNAIEEVIDLSSDTLAADLERGTNSGIYTAFTFDMELTVYFGAVGDDLALYLDVANSAMTAKDPSGNTVTGSSIKTAKGFRMAFVAKSASEAESTVQTRVWTKLQSTTLGATPTYVSNPAVDGVLTTAASTSATSGTGNGSYTTDLIDGSYNTALPADSGNDRLTAAAALLRNDCLGVFAFKASSTVTLRYTVVCWYEGTDPEIQNRALAEEYQQVGATIKLEAKSCKAAQQQQNP